MRIEREEPEPRFRPISIVLENAVELDNFIYLLHYGYIKDSNNRMWLGGLLKPDSLEDFGIALERMIHSAS